MRALLGGGPADLLPALLLASRVAGVDEVVALLLLHGGGALHLELEDLLAGEVLLLLGVEEVVDLLGGRGGGAGAGAGAAAGEVVALEGVLEEEVVVGEEGRGTLVVLAVEGAAARPRGEGAGSVVGVQVARLDIHGRRGEG